MTKGKWFAFIAVLMLGLMMIPNVVEAEIASGAGWELMDDGTLLIHSNITISGIYKTPWNSHSNEIKQVKIDDGVNYIGNYAFYFAKVYLMFLFQIPSFQLVNTLSILAPA